MGVFNDWLKKVVNEEGKKQPKPISVGPKSKHKKKVVKAVKEEKVSKTSHKSTPKKIKKASKKVDSIVVKKTKKVTKKVKSETKKALVKKTTKKKVDSIVVKKVRKKVLKKKQEEKKHADVHKKIKHIVKKFEGNPIIAPSEKNRWESKATFNPAVLHAEGKIHLLYRAMGDSDVSVLGYTASEDGFTMTERSDEPVYFSTKTHEALKKKNKGKKSPIDYVSGGGLNGGCEDPRLTLIEDTVYLTYTAFDGWGSLRMALSSISLKDFLKKKWNWKKPIMISRPGEIHKNWVLFPEKIDGKFAVLHSINPDILIEQLDDLEFNDKEHIDGFFSTQKNKDRWDSWVRGAGPPPIKTKDGWLLIYHAMDIYNDPDKYKMGAMLLDLKNPQKIIARSKEPILEPDMHYENEGWKAGVSYCCGAVVKDDQLMIYYGGADKVSCVATADADKFVKTLLKSGKPKVKPLDDSRDSR
ncbi:hypothetical protein A2996_02535 [Candidatus Campbellbacteria bacterium RIFCSPLOWO2_01_FULL_34_15]|uniref:Glycosidase n=2 Tax=Candidatus Campbelliibacteriota TaxID=1752727 RepID=A0A1F5EM57_9BACT|nr:MAG: hypothetical protein A2811_02355 [Candidatus Campbellbacteria bacterium RIFCSPHIGHO2_01_FULL_34_10]OGD68314.1 MAG: hypothetical protein A2996_02535 [Candidatus Campbellbacteria bacterium RIFCSPLOWO2_01_FULL_34_15]